MKQLLRAPPLRQCLWRPSTWPIPAPRRGRGPWPRTQAAAASSISTSASFPNLNEIDAKWQARWKALPETASGASAKEKCYILPMFPYPSGVLHLGHLRVYTISDVIARFKHMQGYNVLHPIGWDAFGLPAENAAIERGVHPADWTAHNIKIMKEQLPAMGGKWNWDREFQTCDPSFYKHTQRIFLLLHERGLAYQEKSLVNFDPVDGTVLANEQVDANGFSWRSGAKVEKIHLRQWFLRIKEFQQALLDDLEPIAEEKLWPERVTSMQRNWIGRSKGVKLEFEIESDPEFGEFLPVEVFTTRLDTLFGVQYLALSLRHPIVLELAKEDPDLQAFIDGAPSLGFESKAGYLLPNVRAYSPVSDFVGPYTKVDEPILVYAAPYVLDDYGSGAVMGVPGHDTRDHAFWRENQDREPILTVVASLDNPSPASSYLLPGEGDIPITQKGILTMASGPFCGLSSDEAMTEMISKLQKHGKRAELSENWRLRDWLISRQRYWGTPIPIVHCESCGPVPVPVSDLPVLLPKIPSAALKGKGGNPLESVSEWVNTTCPSCQGPAKRETDTMDTFMDSSWYFFRFVDPYNQVSPVSPDAADTNLPVDIYIGGIEHAILHLLYARFLSKFLATTSLWPSGGGPTNRGEPFKKLISQGMVHGKTYTDPITGRYLKPDEVDLSDASSPMIIATGSTPNISFEKMSKSKYNGVDPGTTISKYGADATRAHILFQAPVTEVLEWEEERIVGIQRWFHRVWRLSSSSFSPHGEELNLSSLPVIDAADLNDQEAELWLMAQTTIQSVTTALDKTYSLNTVVSDLIKLTNSLHDALLEKNISSAILHHSVSVLLRMLAPIAPAFAEECWETLHHKTGGISLSTAKSIFSYTFPVTDAEIIPLLSNRAQTCAVQVNGKLKFATKIPVPTAEMQKAGGQVLQDWVMGQLKVTKDGQFFFGKMIDLERDVTKVIVVKGGKTVNLVVKKA